MQPEHILIDERGEPHIALANSAKFVTLGVQEGECLLNGPAEYYCKNKITIAPEILASKPITVAHDYWCLGVMIFEMLVGPTPFECETPKQTRLFIEKLDPKYPNNMEISKETKELISNFFI